MKAREITPEDVLHATVNELRHLEGLAETAMEMGMMDGYEKGHRRRAQIVAHLPRKLVEATLESEIDLPEKEKLEIGALSVRAIEALENDSLFGMSTVLERTVSKIDEPNDLEKIVNSLYPRK